VYYEDGVSALSFLTNVLGFQERTRELRPDGTLMHGEVMCGDNVIMVGTPLDEDNRPQRLARQSPQPGSIMCYVDDVDSHYQRARSGAGAKVISEVADQPYGLRMYGIADPEGHHWYFASPVKEK
jgi:uncharacterized glyoxalase superfamily protein PhnB